MGYFQETLSLLMDYSYISTWNKKNKICKKKNNVMFKKSKDFWQRNRCDL